MISSALKQQPNNPEYKLFPGKQIMDIGRKPLTDAEFTNLWSILHNEFFTLSVTETCDASLVYNTIYIICTSNSSYEDKLYWKVGDFFYNRCKEHKCGILFSEDYISEYITRFSKYESLVRSVDRLGTLLNECISGKKIDEFGYLLWERVVIQNLKSRFFEDIFNYGSRDRIAAVETFAKIVPDPSDRLLYYRERYEKIGLERVRQSYSSVPEIKDVGAFCSRVFEIVQYERENMASYFLPESFKKVESVLEECLFGDRYQEIILNVKGMIEAENIENIGKMIRKGNEQRQENFQINVKPIEDKGGNVKNYVEEEFVQNKALSQIKCLIEKERTGDSGSVGSNEVYNALFRELGVLESGFVILKKAYSLYVDGIIGQFPFILSTSVRNIYNLIDCLDVFNVHEDFSEILRSILRYYLQRTKPCFITRLCEFSDNLVVKITCDAKPFDQDECSRVFFGLIQLISDNREFLNVYQSTLRKRLLGRRSDIEREQDVLSALGLHNDDRISKMVHDIAECPGRLRMLNSVYWNIEPKNSHLRIPKELLKAINAENRALEAATIDGKSIFKYKLASRSPPVSGCHDAEHREDMHICSNYGNEWGSIVYRMRLPGGKDRVVHLAHQFSKVTLQVLGSVITMNIYQYTILDLVICRGRSFRDISQLLKLSEPITRNALNSLVSAGLIRSESGCYLFDGEELHDGDISEMAEDSIMDSEICVESYLQSLCASVLKKERLVNREDLIVEITELSRVEISREVAMATIEKIVEKGIGDAKEDNVEYVF